MGVDEAQPPPEDKEQHELLPAQQKVHGGEIYIGGQEATVTARETEEQRMRR